MQAAKSVSERSKFDCVYGVYSSLLSLKKMQATFAHFSAVEEGLGKFLKLIQASLTAQVYQFQSK